MLECVLRSRTGVEENENEIISNCEMWSRALGQSATGETNWNK